MILIHFKGSVEVKQAITIRHTRTHARNYNTHRRHTMFGDVSMALKITLHFSWNG